jgi:hypothetical protein
MIRAKWQHWKNPRTKKWDGQSHKKGRVLFFSRQGYNRERDCLDAIESSSGSRESTLVEFKDRVRSPK